MKTMTEIKLPYGKITQVMEIIKTWDSYLIVLG